MPLWPKLKAAPFKANPELLRTEWHETLLPNHPFYLLTIPRFTIKKTLPSSVFYYLLL